MKQKRLFASVLSLSLALAAVPGVAVNADENTSQGESIQEMIDLSAEYNNHMSYHGYYADHNLSKTSDTEEKDDKNVGYHKDYLLISGNDGNFTATNGIKDYTFKGVVDPEGTGNTILTKNGIDFDFKTTVKANPGATGAADSIRVKGTGKTIPVNGVFGKIHFAASARSVINSPVEQAVYKNGIEDYEVIINYTDGTKDTQYVDILGAGYGNQFMEVDSSKLTDTIEYAFKVKDGMTLPENFLLWSKGCMVYKSTSTTVGNDFSLWYYTVDADPTKTVEAVTFKAKEGTYDTDISKESAEDLLPSNEILLFAMTAEKPVMYEDKTKATVVYLGGSIPELGAGEMFKADGTVTTNEDEAVSKGWCKMITDYLRNKYTGTRFIEINAGWGGTGTSYGFLRLYDDVIKYNPDIVFISCSGNDLSQYGALGIKGSTQAKQNLEAIVRRLASLEKPPEICMVYSSDENLSESRDTAIAWHEEVADYYGIDGVNIHAYLKTLDPTAEENSEIFPNDSFADLFRVNDGVHPNFRGHKVYGNYVISQLESGEAGLNTPLKKNAAFMGDRIEVYNSERIVLRKTGTEGLTLSDDWNEGTYSAYDTGIHDANRVYITNLQSDGSFAESELEFEFTGGIFGLKGVQFTNGTNYSVTIDGKAYSGLTSKANGNGYPVDWVVTGLSKGTHKAVIKAPANGAIYLEHFYVDADSKAADLNEIYMPSANQEFISLNDAFNNHITHYSMFWDSPSDPYGAYGDGGDDEVGIMGAYDFIFKGESASDAYSLKNYVDPEGTGNTTIAKNGIKFDFSKLFKDNTGLGSSKHSVRIMGNGTEIPVSGSFDNIHFAAFARCVTDKSAPENTVLTGSLEDYNVTVKYTDGTEKTAKFDIYGARYINKMIENIGTDGAKEYRFKTDADVPENLLAWGKTSFYSKQQSQHDRIYGIYGYSIDTDPAKTVASISFKPEEGTTDTLTDGSEEDKLPSGEIMLFAMTGEKEANLPQTMFDIGKYCNSLAFAKAGVANNTPHGVWDHFQDSYLVDLVDLENKILDNNYQIEKDGVKYDLSQVKHPYARAIYVGRRTNNAYTKTISDINEYYSQINFIAGRNQSVDKLPVKVTYKDGTSTEKTFTLGSAQPASPLVGNEITTDKCTTGNIGARILNFSPDKDATAYTLYTYSMEVDPTKEVKAVTFGTTDEELLQSVSAWIFAVTGINANNFELSEAALLTRDYKSIENPIEYAGEKVYIDFKVKSDVERNGKLMVAVYDGTALVGVESVDLTVEAGISEISKEITIPENINSECEISCMVWDSVNGMKPLFIKNSVN